jgi:hypothetical protein
MNKVVAQSPRGKKEAVTQWQGRSGPRTRLAKQKLSRSEKNEASLTPTGGRRKGAPQGAPRKPQTRTL